MYHMSLCFLLSVYSWCPVCVCPQERIFVCSWLMCAFQPDLWVCLHACSNLYACLWACARVCESLISFMHFFDGGRGEHVLSLGTCLFVCMRAHTFVLMAPRGIQASGFCVSFKVAACRVGEGGGLRLGRVGGGRQKKILKDCLPSGLQGDQPVK